MAENPPINGTADLVSVYGAQEQQQDKMRAQNGRADSRAQNRHWRRVPSINVLPDEKSLLPANFLMRSGLVVGIVMLVLLVSARFLDWKDSEVRAEATEIRSQSVKRQLTARQNEIEPLQSQISLLRSKTLAAERTYGLATSEHTDWFATMNTLFSISVSGVDFLSATVKPDGRVSLVGVATEPEAIASLPNQLSQMPGAVNLQGIQWDAEVSPPEFTAGFKVNR